MQHINSCNKQPTTTTNITTTTAATNSSTTATTTAAHDVHDNDAFLQGIQRKRKY